MELLWTAMLVLGGCSMTLSHGSTPLGPIPDFLVDCYRYDLAYRRDHRLPMSLTTLIALVRKVELEAGANMDIRAVAVNLLHRLRLDGIERNPLVLMAEGVTPYHASGRQLNKQLVLLRQLIPGTVHTFSNESLSLTEKCTLHFMLSSSTDRWERGDERETCPTGTNTSGTGKTGSKNRRKYKSSRTGEYSPDYENDNGVSQCPLEEGVILTKWGTISPGALVAGIAAGLERQQMKLIELLPTPSAEEYKMKSSLSRNYQRYQMLSETDEGLIDNLWAATLAGDLAEVALFQGPRAQPMMIGPGGDWNSTYLPRAYYMDATKNGYWEMTNAETRGGADGLILGHQVKSWNDLLNRLKLSQLIEMYYSDRGVSFAPSFRVCNRREKLYDIMTPSKLLNQTSNFARVLSYELGNVQIDDDTLQAFCEQAVITAKNYESSLAHDHQQCRLVFQRHPRVNLIVILDGTWVPDVALGVLASIAEESDVSYYGSTMTVINGKSGEIMLQETKDAYELAEKVTLDNTTWPIGLDLFESLAKTYDLISYETVEDRKENKIGGFTYVVLVLAYSASLTDTDAQRSKEKINDFKENLPDVRLMYLTSDMNKARFESLLTATPHDKDQVLLSPDDCLETVVPLVITHLVPVPERLTGSTCTNGSTTPMKTQYEDYVLPSETKEYRIHPQYLGSKTVSIVVRGSGYGDLDVCVKLGYDELDNSNCRKGVQAFEQVELKVNEPCGILGSDCKPIFIGVTGVKAFTKCTEDDCRYPHQIRFTIEHEGLNCVHIATGQLSAAPYFVHHMGIFFLSQLLPVLLSQFIVKWS